MPEKGNPERFCFVKISDENPDELSKSSFELRDWTDRKEY